MILKKPYAFFIKYFRLIHLLLTFFSGVIAVYLYKNLNFFNVYIANGYRATSTYQLIETYLPFYVFIIVIFVILLLLSCIFLLKYKSKPYLFYLLELIYIIILLGVFIYLRYILGVLLESLIATTLSRTIRDVLIILFLPFPVFLIISFLRTIGFNIKQFEFNNDIKEFTVGLEDSEEVEINFGGDGYLYKRNIHKYFRELKYYILENKIFVVTICILLFFFLAIMLFVNRTPNYNKTYYQGRNFKYNDFSILIDDSMITNTDYKGLIIKEDSYFLVMRVKVTNEGNNHGQIDFNIFKLMDGNDIIEPSPSYYYYFSDYASYQNGSFIGINNTIEYGVVYEIKPSQIYHKFKVRIDNGTVTYRDNIYNKTIYININPKINSQHSKVYKYQVGEKVSFDSSIIGNNILTINAFEIDKAFNYKYTKKINDKEKEYIGRVYVGTLKDKQDDYILKLDMTYQVDDKSKYRTFKSLLENFGYIKYIKDDEEYSVPFENITPDNYSNGVFLQIPKEIKDADSIKLVLSVRDASYEITLK